MNHVFNILKHTSITDSLIHLSGLPSLWITPTQRQKQVK